MTTTLPAPPEHARATGIPGASVSFRATLTATSNEYLRGRLPIEGLVKIGERDIYGRCSRVQFMPDRRVVCGQGNYEPHTHLASCYTGTSFVAVPDAEFTFTSRF